MSTVTTTTERRGFLDRILKRPSVRSNAPVPVPHSVGAAPTDGHEDASTDLRTPTYPTPTAPGAPRTRFTWSTLLQRVREVTRADAVLAVDEEGLVLGSTGTLASSEIDNIAAHVAMAFDLFERLSVLGKKAESVCAQYVPDGTWLTAIRMRPPTGGRITIAIVGPHTLIREDRRKVRDAFARLFD